MIHLYLLRGICYFECAKYKEAILDLNKFLEQDLMIQDSEAIHQRGYVLGVRAQCWLAKKYSVDPKEASVSNPNELIEYSTQLLKSGLANVKEKRFIRALQDAHDAAEFYLTPFHASLLKSCVKLIEYLMSEAEKKEEKKK